MAEFEWDAGKNRANITKHGVSFELAMRIFEGFTVDAPDDRFTYGEERTISIGMVGGIAILTVAHTDRNGATRLISARQANKQERKRYEQAVRQALDT